MKYLNKKTGAIVDSPSAISGGSWVEYDKQAKDKAPTKVKPKVEAPKDSSNLTKEEIINELEALGIDYNPKAKKDELIKLMMGE